MKLMLKLLLSAMSFILIAAALWFSLPLLLERLAYNQLADLGFSDISIEVDQIGLHSATIEKMQLSNDGYRIELHGLQAGYTLSELLQGSVDSLLADSVIVKRRSHTQSTTTTLPDPLLLLSLLKTAWHEYMPASLMVIRNLSLIDANGETTLHSSAEVRWQGEKISGEIRMLDKRQVEHRLGIDISPRQGIDLQLQALSGDSERPLTIRLQPSKTAQGLVGQLQADLSSIAELGLGLEQWSGQLRADISYVGEAGNRRKDFTLAVQIDDAMLAGIKLRRLSADLQGSFEENDSSLLLSFAESSSLQLLSLEQANNRAARLDIKFPRTLEMVQGMPLLAHGNGAAFELHDVMLDKIKVPAMEIKNIITTHLQQGSTEEPCRFSLQVSAPVVEREGMRYEASPLQLDGSCPYRETMAWSVNARTAKLAIEDSDFRLSFKQCRLNIGNPVDKRPAELAGDFSCESETISGRVDASFRFNPDNGEGRVRYDIPAILPDSDNPLLGKVLKTWDEPFDIVSGTLSASGTYRWWIDSKGKDREALDMQLEVNNAGGYFAGALFSGLSYKDRIVLLPAIKSEDFSALTISDIDIGMPITATSAKLRYSPSRNGPLPVITINDLKMSLFDGMVKGNDLDFDLNSDNNELILVVVGLDMGQIVALQQLDRLSASGRLDGYIPVTITANGIKVSEGKIVAQQQGGQIQYIPAGGTADIEQSAVGSELLFKIRRLLAHHG